MGAWSVDVLGGDTPMDALDTFEDVMGIDRGDDFDKEGLYPLRLSDGLRDQLRNHRCLGTRFTAVKVPRVVRCSTVCLCDLWASEKGVVVQPPTWLCV